MVGKLLTYLRKPTHAAPLAMFRVLFGGIMCISILRFMLKGWVHELYVQPKFFFTYYGFEWVKPFGETGMYFLFGTMAIAALLVMLGLFYRFSITTFFLLFTYVELIDKTNYLNHYYFISIVSFLMILLPAHRYFSLDIIRKRSLKTEKIPRWMPGVIMLQLGMVYFFAGLAKLNPDWLLSAMPLKIWLPANAHLPVIGWLFDYEWTAFAFSWFGAIYDLSIPFLLINKKTRHVAFAAVVVFHLMTAWLFQIGMFPYIMILATLIFFPASFHRKGIEKLQSFFARFKRLPESPSTPFQMNRTGEKLLFAVLVVYFLIQVALPLRHVLYPGNLFWSEEGYRFSWRVMLMEKAGYAIFKVRDPETGKEGEVMNSDYLTPNQEKMMATQPDMILQFARFLKEEYGKKGIQNPEIYSETYVTLNGRGSKPFTDKHVNLAEQQESFKPKQWIMPFVQ